MGDRGNIIIKAQGGKVADLYLYTHWGGYELLNTLHDAMSRRERWNDDQYLARIIFCQMVRGHEINETGFGISTYLGDNEQPLITVDVQARRVSVAEHRGRPGASWTFEEFVALDEAARNRAFRGVEVDDA